MSEEQKPCPFCGSKTKHFGVHSHDCYIRMFSEKFIFGADHSGDAMMAAWNTRHNPEGYALVPISLLKSIIDAHEMSSVDWDAMRELKEAMPKQESK